MSDTAGNYVAYIVPHDLDPASAGPAQKMLLEAIGSCDKGIFPIDIGGRDATQVSLQLLFSGMQELRARDLVCEIGEIALELMETCVLKENEIR